MEATLFQDQDETQPPGEADLARRVAVLVPYPVGKTYDYIVPDDMDLAPGDYVVVPLGKREVPGVVWGEATDDVPAKKLKPIVMMHDVPAMPALHRQFLDWVAQYTMADRGAVLKMSLSVPAALERQKPITGYVIAKDLAPHLNPPPLRRGEDWRGVLEKSRELRRNTTDAENKLWYYLRKKQLGSRFRRQYQIPPYIVDFVCLEKKLVIELDGGQHSDQKQYDDKRSALLEKRGFTVLRFWNNDVLKNIDGVLETIKASLFSGKATGQGDFTPDALKGLTPQRRNVINVLKDGMARRASELAELAGCTAGVIRGMEKSGLLDSVPIYSAAPCRKPDALREGAELAPAQRAAADILIQHIREGGFKPSLMDGVTGAGKTEVYFEAIAETLKQGRQVLLLLPEIALSNAFLDRFRSRFGCAPGLWHSSISPAQRRNTWRGVAKGEVKVIVGARSALFLPYADLGLIIVDEEHDPAYKQEDGVIYNARDMAVVRAHLGHIPITLVSATPSLETWVNAASERYAYLHLPDRFGGARLPSIHVIDLREDRPEKRHFIAPTLRLAMEETLKNGEQVLLFLNRRGYAPLTVCRSCGHRMNCPRCTAWLVEHRRINRLQCHHCAYTITIPEKCPECGEEDSLAACGPGVERIAEEIEEHFPDARLCVLSSDANTTTETMRQKLEAIKENNFDIIVGTQIIAKGHHFPMLTTVGIIDADLGLSGGDLRASERTYQLLHQVAGRAGRESREGHVYIQTYMPQNQVIQALASNDREAFLGVEDAERESAHMPPYARLVGIIVSGVHEDEVIAVAKRLGQSAPQNEQVNTLGPAPAPLARLRGKYRYRLLVIADKEIAIQKTIRHWIGKIEKPSAVRIQIDIDPQSFL